MEIRESYKWRSKSPGDGGQRSLLTRRTSPRFCFRVRSQGAEAELATSIFPFSTTLSFPHESVFCSGALSAAPQSSAAGWKLSITGAVEKPSRFHSTTCPPHRGRLLPVTLECAENPVGRRLGQPCGMGRRPAQLASRKSASEAAERTSFAFPERMASRADSASTKAMHPGFAGRVQHEWREAARESWVPAACRVPGWYGMDSVKWLRGDCDPIGAGAG